MLRKCGYFVPIGLITDEKVYTLYKQLALPHEDHSSNSNSVTVVTHILKLKDTNIHRNPSVATQHTLISYF